jgi:gluconate 5-dehydrogenase
VNDIFSLSGKTALVAGASKGLGLGIAKAVAAAGAHTVLASRTLDKLEAEAAALREQGYSASAARLDTRDPASIDALVAGLDRIDILYDVVGMNIRKPFLDYTKEEYDLIMQTNMHGLVELTQKVGAKMIGRGEGGKIVTIGSLASLIGLPFMAVYTLTKGGLGLWTRALAAEWGRYNIQVNCIAPGFILTDLNREIFEQPHMRKWLFEGQAAQRIGQPEDLSPLAVFLGGRGSDYITGQIIAVDGGFSTTAVWPYVPPAK